MCIVILSRTKKRAGVREGYSEKELNSSRNKGQASG